MPTGHYQRKPRVERVPITCQVCGVVRHYVPSEVRRRPPIKYCSFKCMGIANAKQVRRECAKCGKEFFRCAARLKARFCSSDCAKSGRRVEGAKWRDPQQIKQYMAAYVQRNRDKHNERSRAWNAANPHKKATIRQKRRARHVGGTLTAEQWAWLVKRCGGCLCCGRSDVKLTPDHVIPLSRGGPNDLWNIQPLCASCNSRKNTATTDYRSQELLIEIQEKEEEMTVRSRGTTRCDFCPRRATWMLPHTGEIYCSGCRAKALEVVKKMEPIKAESLIKQLTEALIWCSAASDFQEGGVAREGWLKTAPLIDQASAYLARKTERP